MCLCVCEYDCSRRFSVLYRVHTRIGKHTLFVCLLSAMFMLATYKHRTCLAKRADSGHRRHRRQRYRCRHHRRHRTLANPRTHANARGTNIVHCNRAACVKRVFSNSTEPILTANF